uniref:ascorbate ferrireductase (transmembrane) n=1 Tax=Globodera rostochiensis TaxID=31243 RepID=A0A914H8E3_GLORO
MFVRWLIVTPLLLLVVAPFVLGQNNSSNSTGGAGGETKNGISSMFLLKCHGILMTLAWLLFAPTAILFSRFQRDPLKRLLGEHLWFQVHRLLNMLTVICVLIAFVCVLSGIGGVWAGPTIYLSAKENFAWPSLHALFGLITVLVTVFQPVSALFRCHPDSSARVVFNVLHAITGYIGWLSAMIAICIACTVFHLFASPMAASVLIIVFLVLLVVVVALMQFVAIRKSRHENVEWIDQRQLFTAASVICVVIAGPQVSGRKFRAAKFGPQNSGRKFRAANFGPQNSGRKFRAANFGPQNSGRKIRAAKFGPQVSGRKFRAAKFGPQNSGRKIRAASFGPQISGRKIRAAKFGPQVSGRKFRAANFGPQNSGRKFRTTDESTQI